MRPPGGYRSGRIAVLGRRSRCARQLELVQALAVVGQRDQMPLPGHLALAAQGEAAKAEHRFDDAEDRLDGLLSQLVERTALFAGKLARHGLQPIGLGLLRRHLGPGRAKVVAPPAALGPGCHQGFDATLGQAFDLIAVGMSARTVSGRPSAVGIAAMSATSSLRSLAHWLTRAPRISWLPSASTTAWAL